MAKKASKKYDKKNEPAKKKHFKTPTETWWGKAVVWIIFFGMVGVLFLTLILAIVNSGA